MPTNVTANIRAEMARRGVTQKALSEALGINQSGVSERLNGNVPLRVDELLQIAALLDVPVSTLAPSEPVAS